MMTNRGSRVFDLSMFKEVIFWLASFKLLYEIVHSAIQHRKKILRGMIMALGLAVLPVLFFFIALGTSFVVPFVTSFIYLPSSGSMAVAPMPLWEDLVFASVCACVPIVASMKKFVKANS
jgi:hypothetical protein